jgi:hypothetical protein
MLFKNKTLSQIESGQVTLAFRKWKRPTIKEGGNLTTRIGILEIVKLDIVEFESITELELKKAGIEDRISWQKEINNKKQGNLYRIEFRLKGPDPRIALRNNSDLTSEDITTLVKRFKRMDNSSKYGPWTKRTLSIIQKHPKKRAVFIAEKLEVEKDWLKPQIRKLKGLGLTISHEIGYEISPRGQALLQKL